MPVRSVCALYDVTQLRVAHGAWQISGETWPDDPAYGDHRFTNGPTYIEMVAKYYELSLENYACGGATSDNDLSRGRTGANGEFQSPSLIDQVDAYMKRHEFSTIPHTSLFVFLAGINDVFFDPEVHPYQTTEKIEVLVQRLQPKGAYAFLLGVPYSLANTPWANSSYAPDAEQLHNLEAFASQLRRDITKLRIRLSSREFRLQVAILDLYALFRHVIARPHQYGLEASDIEKPCLTGTYGDKTARTLCQKPEHRLWWDLFHPTRAAHEIIAKDAQGIIKRHFGRLPVGGKAGG